VYVTRPTADAEARSLDEGDGPAEGTQRRRLTSEGPADRHAVSPFRGREVLNRRSYGDRRPGAPWRKRVNRKDAV
jgi:hypothetical protein